MAWQEGGTPERPAIFFATAQDFRDWLEEHHESESELWMGLYKKHVGERGLTWEQAVPQALCFGWIDSVSQRIDDDARRQRWTPRKRGSTWSAVNVAHVERLTAQGLMHPAGVAAFEARLADRTGTYSYETQRDLSPERASALSQDPAAQAFWEAATAGYRRTAVSWVESAKLEATREKRFQELLTCCATGQMVPPTRYGAVPGWLERAAGAAASARRTT